MTGKKNVAARRKNLKAIAGSRGPALAQYLVVVDAERDADYGQEARHEVVLTSSFRPSARSSAGQPRDLYQGIRCRLREFLPKGNEGLPVWPLDEDGCSALFVSGQLAGMEGHCTKSEADEQVEESRMLTVKEWAERLGYPIDF